MHSSIHRLYFILAAVALCAAVAAFGGPSASWVATGFPVAQAGFAKLASAGS